jgi:hypothetical protein
MVGIFDLKKGAFDSSEAASLLQAYEIALHGLKTTHPVERPLRHRLARSIVKVARSEPDCLRNDGTIDPVRLAQRAILRMLQMSAPTIGANERQRPTFRERFVGKSEAPPAPDAIASPESPAKIMLRLFERTPFAKL